MIEWSPEGWKLVKLGQITSKVGSGSTPRGGSESYQYTGIPLIRSMNVRFEGFAKEGLAFLNQRQADALKEVTVHSGDVLLNITGASIGRVTQAPTYMDGARVNQHVCIIRPIPGVGADYVSHYLASPSVQRKIWQEQYGVTRQALTKNQILDCDILLAPYREQQRIVAKIRKLFRQVDSIRDHLSIVSATLKRFRRGVLAAAVSGRLIENGAISKGHASLKWQRQRIDSLFVVKTGGTPSRKVKEYFVGGSVPWVKTGELKNTGITRVEEHITDRAVRESNAKVFPVGTILIAMYGEGKTRGQIGRLTFPAATNQACAALVNTTLPSETIEYVFTYLLSQYETIRAEAVGGNQPNLNLSIIREWEIPLPPLGEQRKIVHRVNALFGLADAIEHRVAIASAQAHKLTQAILAKAFRGELVPIEAELARREGRDYESASALLERIKRHGESECVEKPKRRLRERKAKAASARGEA